VKASRYLSLTVSQIDGVLLKNFVIRTIVGGYRLNNLIKWTLAVLPLQSEEKCKSALLVKDKVIPMRYRFIEGRSACP